MVSRAVQLSEDEDSEHTSHLTGEWNFEEGGKCLND